MGGDISCVIDQLTGLTIVQTMKSANGIGVFTGLTGSAIRAILQRMDSNRAQIFLKDEGSVGWQYEQ